MYLRHVCQKLKIYCNKCQPTIYSLFPDVHIRKSDMIIHLWPPTHKHYLCMLEQISIHSSVKMS